MIYEIRDYHYRPDLFDAYKAWADEAVPVLKKNLDLVGFWIENGVADPEITGTNPMNPDIGWANVTWIIRWKDKADRDANFRAAMSGDDWQAVWAKHPDPNGYVQMAARFMEAM